MLVLLVAGALALPLPLFAMLEVVASDLLFLVPLPLPVLAQAQIGLSIST
jgi:hypothetical protein